MLTSFPRQKMRVSAFLHALIIVPTALLLIIPIEATKHSSAESFPKLERIGSHKGTRIIKPSESKSTHQLSESKTF